MQPNQQPKKKRLLSGAALATAAGGIGAIGASMAIRRKPGMLGVKPKNAAALANKVKDAGYIAGAGAGGMAAVDSFKKSYGLEDKRESRQKATTLALGVGGAGLAASPALERDKKVRRGLRKKPQGIGRAMASGKGRVIAGGALVAGGAVNELQRRKSGRPYTSYYDG